MTNLRTVAALTLVGTVVAVPSAVAATSTPPSPAATSGPSSTSATSPAASGSSSASTSGSLRVDHPITLRLDDKKHVDTSMLPDEGTLFTEAELAQAIPDLQSVERTDDTLTLMIKGETDADRSKLVINLKRFGTKDDVSKAWATEKQAHEARAKSDPGLYTFFGAKFPHVADAFSDGTTAHVLLNDGDAAGEIWVSGIGFEALGDTHADARRAYRDRVVPALVNLLGEKLARGASSKDATHDAKKPTAGPSSSTTSSSTTK